MAKTLEVARWARFLVAPRPFLVLVAIAMISFRVEFVRKKLQWGNLENVQINKTNDASTSPAGNNKTDRRQLQYYRYHWMGNDWCSPAVVRPKQTLKNGSNVK